MSGSRVWQQRIGYFLVFRLFLSLLVYRNMKPYYRFTVPQLYLHPPEIELWERVFNDKEYPVRQLCEGLKNCAKEVESLAKSLFNVYYRSRSAH